MEKILWDIPLAWLYQAEHVFLYMEGVKVRRSNHVTGSDIRDMELLLGL
jgi:hypothetical protein